MMELVVPHRFFVAHSKDLSDKALGILNGALQHHLAPAAGGQPFRLTLARDEFKESFDRCGGWNEWIDHVVHGRYFDSREYRFTAFISSGRILGKATADILRLALVRPAPVVVFEFDDTLKNWVLRDAKKVTQVEANNFKSGWWLG